MRKRSDIYIVLLAVAVTVMTLCRPQPASAVSTITVTSSGNGVFLVQGIGIENAAALEIAITYNAAALTNPRVAMGPLIAGGMNAVNANRPGQIHIVIVRLTPVQGSGVIANITFDRTGTSPGGITMLSAKLANIQGAQLPSSVLITSPMDQQAIASEQTRAGELPSGQGASGDAEIAAQTAALPIIIAGPSGKDSAETTAPEGAVPDNGTGSTTPGGQEASDGDGPLIADRSTEAAPSKNDKVRSEERPVRKIFSQQGALERFEEYRGERTIGAFLALFDQESFIGYRQDPPVALSDGRTPIKVRFVTTPGNKTASDVAVIGARLLSMKSDPEYSNTWIVELLPERGAYEASLTVLQGNMAMVYPITVAPMVVFDAARQKHLSEHDYRRYVVSTLKARSPRLDMNKDGKWDYRDDYILTANYLCASKRQRK